MRIGLYEYITVELADVADVPESLRTEGQAMLAAVAADFSGIPGVEAIPFTPHPAMPWVERFQMQVQQVDYVLLIAPEFEDILLTRCRWVENAGGKLLGPSAEAVRLTADKLSLGQHLTEQHIPTPPSVVYEPGQPPSEFGRVVVVKPRWGAGSQATYRIELPREVSVSAGPPSMPDWCGEAIVQPCLAGQPASVAFLIGPRQTLPLLPASQDITTDGRFRYLGGSVPLPEELARRAVSLAQRAIQTVPGLRGYVGVDLMLGDHPSGAEDAVLEINPRLTTSYVGLRALARTNLAEAMLQIATGAEGVQVQWRPGRVRFRAEGTIEHLRG